MTGCFDYFFKKDDESKAMTYKCLLRFSTHHSAHGTYLRLADTHSDNPTALIAKLPTPHHFPQTQ